MNLRRLWSYRKIILLFLLLVLSVLILMTHQKQALSEGPAGRIVLVIFDPLFKVTAWLDERMEDLFDVVLSRSSLRRENETLQQELAALQVKYSVLKHEMMKLQHLEALEMHDLARSFRLLPASVAAVSPNPWSRTVIIDKGVLQGVRTNMSVVHPKGLVGIVREATPNSAVVQLLIDQRSAVGVRIEESRERGIVRGLGTPERYELLLEEPGEAPQEGSTVVTSGLQGSHFAGGLLVGTVSGTKKNKYGQTIATVKPAVNMNRLEEVLIILGSEEGN
jgi:rod shape-determining protein MreC